jgi:hypothetical protein
MPPSAAIRSSVGVRYTLTCGPVSRAYTHMCRLTSKLETIPSTLSSLSLSLSFLISLRSFCISPICVLRLLASLRQSTSSSTRRIRRAATGVQDRLKPTSCATPSSRRPPTRCRDHSARSSSSSSSAPASPSSLDFSSTRSSAAGLRSVHSFASTFWVGISMNTWWACAHVLCFLAANQPGVRRDLLNHVQGRGTPWPPSSARHCLRHAAAFPSPSSEELLNVRG